MNSKPKGQKSSEKLNICVATPCFAGNVAQSYHVSMMELADTCRTAGVDFTAIYTGGDSLITRARNSLANRMLADQRFTHLFFIDADIGFSASQAMRVIQSGLDVVGGIYPVKAVFWDRLALAETLSPADREARSLEYVVGIGSSSVEEKNGFITVERVGTGFLLIRRNVLEALAAAHPELRYHSHDSAGRDASQAQVETALFDTMIEPDTGRYLSEDYAFCHRCRAQGFRVWADLRSQLTHVGYATFSGDVAVKIRPGS